MRIGRPPASRVLAEWIARSVAAWSSRSADRVSSIPATTSRSSARSTISRTSAAPRARRGRRVGDMPRSVRWRRSRRRWPPTSRSPSPVWRTSSPRRCPHDVELVVASSMPVRDLEWFGGPRRDAHANRGANGIDGVVSTALGRALTGTPTVVLVGDIAFVHDSNALVASPRSLGRPADRRRRQRRRWHLLVPPAGDGAPRRSVRDAARHAARHRHRRPRPRPRNPRGDDHRRARAGGASDAAGAVARSRPDQPRRQRRRPRPPQRRRRRRPRLNETLGPVCFIRRVGFI